MNAAVELANEIVGGFVADHPDCFPPLVVNLTDGQPTDANPLAAAQRSEGAEKHATGTCSCSTPTCPVSPAPPIAFPNGEDGLPDVFSKLLFRMSSMLPPPMAQAAREEGYTLTGAGPRVRLQRRPGGRHPVPGDRHARGVGRPLIAGRVCGNERYRRDRPHRVRSPCPRTGNAAEECEDAFACNDPAGRFAVADGASESIFAGEWARLLCEAFVADAAAGDGIGPWLEAAPEAVAGPRPWADRPLARARRSCGTGRSPRSSAWWSSSRGPGWRAVASRRRQLPVPGPGGRPAAGVPRGGGGRLRHAADPDRLPPARPGAGDRGRGNAPGPGTGCC